jgi:TorA maturation chaperone TorD|tara:strand:+ start:1841 stop:2233 length:393 start_codon:yes stop_codon:yes gene_type:complete
MATLTPTLTLASTDLSSAEALSLSVTDSLSVAGGAQSFQKVVSNTKSNLLLASAYTKSYVFLQNLDSSIVIHIGMDTEADDTIDNDATDLFIELAAGEFAFFPWSSTYNLHVDAASGTPTLEVRVFQAAS